MEQRKQITLGDGTVISADPGRAYTRFLKVEAGVATVVFSLTAAEALYELLGAYFAQPEVHEAQAAETRTGLTAVREAMGGGR